MPRANRYFLPDHVWHITHRCHKEEFLLKFAKDRKRFYSVIYQIPGINLKRVCLAYSG